MNRLQAAFAVVTTHCQFINVPCKPYIKPCSAHGVHWPSFLIDRHLACAEDGALGAADLVRLDVA